MMIFFLFYYIDFLWVTPNENLDEEVKMYVLKERYHRLMKLVPLLNKKDSLHQGWEALKILLTAVEQGMLLNYRKSILCLRVDS